MRTADADFYTNSTVAWRVLNREALHKLFPAEEHAGAFQKRSHVLQPGGCYHMVFDTAQMELEFVSPEIEAVLGFSPGEVTAAFLLARIHPDDKPYFLSFEQKLTLFYLQLPFEKKALYRYQYDCRVRTKGAPYVRVLHQILPLHYDEENFYRSLLLHTDITHLKPYGAPGFSIIGLEGEPSYYNIGREGNRPEEAPVLSEREKDVIRCLVAGQKSQQIADELFLSVHTVSTHRKNIRRKARCAPADLVRRAILEGWV